MPIGLPLAFDGQAGIENFTRSGLLAIRVKQAGVEYLQPVAFTNFTLEINCKGIHTDKLNDL